uniref:Trehalase n=1 Tax=Brugia malayi TaxID=6279 RepID=A0A0H5S9B4_BRUMA|nr:Bm10630 [Brugia malayi]
MNKKRQLQFTDIRQYKELDKVIADIESTKQKNNEVCDETDKIANCVQKLINFRNRFFGEPGTELKGCVIPEWKELPPKIARIKDENLKRFALFLNQRWKDLCRQGILLLGRILDCERFGFVPNGGRIYYLRRSQPPFLTPMMYEYYEATGDIEFIKENFNHLVKEYEFWVQNRSVSVIDEKGYKHKIYQYHTISNVPRPESFRADIRAAVEVGKNDRQKFFQDIASAAESGWDFSSRWFRDRNTMKTIETTNILPVDLNSLLCWNVNILKYFANIIGNTQKAEEFEKKGQEAWKALNAIFYNKLKKAWFDYNFRIKSHNTLFYPTVAMPLFTGCYTMLDYGKSTKVIDFMNESNVFNYPSGIPASLKNTGQQWDLPNGWPPLQHIIIEGMRKSDNPEAQEMIDVTGTIPKPGAGGEYDVQDGFGWTNGVVLDLLTTYYDRMTIGDIGQNVTHGPSVRPCRSKTHRIRYRLVPLLCTTVFYFLRL